MLFPVIYLPFPRSDLLCNLFLLSPQSRTRSHTFQGNLTKFDTFTFNGAISLVFPNNLKCSKQFGNVLHSFKMFMDTYSSEVLLRKWELISRSHIQSNLKGSISALPIMVHIISVRNNGAQMLVQEETHAINDTLSECEVSIIWIEMSSWP